MPYFDNSENVKSLIREFFTQGDDRAGNGVAHRLGTVSGECGSVFHTSFMAVTGHTRQVQQESEAGRALHQGADCGTAETQNEVPFPVARHGAIGYRRRTLTDHDLGREKGLAASARARSRHPQCPPGAQAGRQLAAQHSSPLDEQRLIDGFMADAHARIIWEVDRQASGDLLRAPSVCPPPVLPRSMPTTFPRYRRAGNKTPARSYDDTSLAFFHMVRNAMLIAEVVRFACRTA